MSDHKIETLGVIHAKISLDSLDNNEFKIALYVLSDNTFQGHVIIGREFIAKESLTFVYKPHSHDDERVVLFSCLPLCVDEETSEKSPEDLNSCDIDFGYKYKQQLKNLFEVRNMPIEVIADDYTVRVNIKDPSIYAYAPRRFAHVESLQIRQIIDDLLERGIIQLSVSSYCARIVPVRKKNGKLRICVDLRPLNNRINKQKYPFPVIEESLSRLANRTVFTLLDLKDSFHQIRVHKDDTKYFSFATPDGQYEYKCLPFGYSEAPAEFQKRLIQILNPFIRNDQIIVYIDDVLIATETIEQNLQILRDVLLILKKYCFELNFSKCKFLRGKVEFLGYVLSESGITLSPRHRRC